MIDNIRWSSKYSEIADIVNGPLNSLFNDTVTTQRDGKHKVYLMSLYCCSHTPIFKSSSHAVDVRISSH
jgi:hypothetical protein